MDNNDINPNTSRSIPDGSYQPPTELLSDEQGYQPPTELLSDEQGYQPASPNQPAAKPKSENRQIRFAGQETVNNAQSTSEMQYSQPNTELLSNDPGFQPGTQVLSDDANFQPGTQVLSDDANFQPASQTQPNNRQINFAGQNNSANTPNQFPNSGFPQSPQNQFFGQDNSANTPPQFPNAGFPQSPQNQFSGQDNSANTPPQFPNSGFPQNPQSSYPGQDNSGNAQNQYADPFSQPPINKKKKNPALKIVLILVFIFLVLPIIIAVAVPIFNAVGKDKQNSYDYTYSDVETTTPLVPVAVENGEMIIKSDYNGYCAFKVKTSVTFAEGSDSATDTNCGYYIYLKYIGTVDSIIDRTLIDENVTSPQSDLAFYVKAGETAEIDVPIGKYELYYATGTEYYGAELLFGDSTVRYASDDTLEFYVDENYNSSYITLTLQASNGNSSSRKVQNGEFPDATTAVQDSTTVESTTE